MPCNYWGQLECLLIVLVREIILNLKLSILKYFLSIDGPLLKNHNKISCCLLALHYFKQCYKI